MKRTFQSTIAMALLTCGAAIAQAQCGGATVGSNWGGCLTYNNQAPMGGTTQMVEPVCPCNGRQYHSRFRTVQYGFRDNFSPHPYYAYSRRGVDAARTNEWNESQMASCPWHGGYSYWRWQQPTALVVPPTAAFQSEYNWGVAQTRSLPINHQFGTGDAGMISGGAAGNFPPTPYWPSSTSQFGIYPVRGPWH